MSGSVPSTPRPRWQGPSGAVVTKGGLVFSGGGDFAFHALDKATGRDLWSAPVRETTGTPMTYQSRSGRQFVVVATGRGADAALVAFALGGQPSSAAAEPVAQSERRSSSAPTSSASPTPAQLDAGRAAFAKAKCEACHGPGANGAGQGPALVPFTRHLGELTAIVSQGVGLVPGVPRDVATAAAITRILAY